ncbi:MAG: thiol-disulfide isomerase [Candidatus Diapherotrites archaeon CG11_big_fil_rev_8_21_14_0_20_37_9]|nr:MAG: thiol-disulfide isomerase [Candidatus Diapherotrites archaeon CG11_big_fil_rev_8_21_14_0_20_37_9]
MGEKNAKTNGVRANAILQPNNPILLLIIGVAIIGGIFFFQGLRADNGGGEVQAIKVDKSGFQIAPELQSIEGYINVDESLTLESLKGKVVLLDFWTYSCINCIRTLPYLNDWYEKYADKGFVIVGVHAPEFEFEKDYINVKEAVEKYGVKFPVVQDNGFSTWRAYNNHYWPHKFLIDADGYIRYDHIGEGSYEETEAKIVELLNEKDSGENISVEDSAIKQDTDFSGIGTPEIYLGAKFARAPLGNAEGFALESPIEYSIPQDLQSNIVYLEGTWKTEDDFSRLVSDTGKVALVYKAKNVNIVAASPTSSKLNVFVDGANLGMIDVKEEDLYTLVSGKDYEPRALIFDVTGKGFELYTFTFG